MNCLNCNNISIFCRGYCSKCYSSLRRANILHLLYNKEIKYLTDEQNQIILGSLLGDAWMALSRKGDVMLRFKHQAKDLDYINWKYEKLKDLCAAAPKYKEYFDKRTQKTYSSYTFNTLSYHELTPYYQDFYLDKILLNK